VHGGDDVDPVTADRADPPGDEQGREQAVEDLDAGGAGLLAEKPEHSWKLRRG
jgi:hypothetical protein